MGRRFGRPILTALVALAPVVCLGQVFPGFQGLSADNASAKLTVREGQVSIYKDQTYWAIDVGDAVRAGQLVVTGADGHAVFQVSDGSTFEVFPNSQATFRANPGSLRDLLDVWLGKIRVHVQRPGGQPNPNRVFTPTAIISVRGTVFDVSVDEDGDATTIAVEEGLVAVDHRLLPRNFEPKILHQGEELTVQRNLPLDEARHFDFGRALQIASEVCLQILVRTPHAPGGTTSGGGISLPGDSGAHPPPPPPHK